MNEQSRNLKVGIFMVLALAALTWMIYKFGNLPQIIGQYNGKEIYVYFTQAPGVGLDTDVLFRGFPVGKVTNVNRPQLLPGPQENPTDYYVVATISLDPEQQIPANVIPKVHKRGLGGSFIEFILTQPPSTELVQANAVMIGQLSDASDFISEQTQHQMDALIGSLMRLSDTLLLQLETRTPQEVDTDPTGQLQANATTVVLRMDEALRNLNIYLADVENQQNFKQGLADIAALSVETRAAVQQIVSIATESAGLIEQVDTTMENLNNLAEGATTSFQSTSASFQNVADQLAVSLHHTNNILTQMQAGTGTAGKILTDAQLYESMVDTVANLNYAISELRQLMDQWADEGIGVDLQ